MNQQRRIAILLLVLVLIFGLIEGEARKRDGKFFNIFQVISFPNGPCDGSSSRNGTCYTEQECESKGGSNSGTCAAGFGVCCTFTVNCGQMSMENCTYFESSGTMAGGCVAEICPCNDNICQLRLDFDSFVITGPSTSTDTVTFRRPNGGDVTVQLGDATLTDNQKVSLTEFTQCLTDTFSVTNPSGANPPTICGTNTGEHMYVEASDSCNELAFTLGNEGIGASMATRAWSIKVTQYSCNYPNLAPHGCTQYFFDATSDQVRSFNFNNGNGVHLANQDQNICIRRERNNCRICWTQQSNADFATTGGRPANDVNSLRNPNRCCDYGASIPSTKLGFDCVIIPSNLRSTANPLPRQSAHCGNNGLKGETTCSTRTPFQISFRSDQWEPLLEVTAIAGITTAQGNNRGFQLTYIMDSSGCNPAGVTG